MTADFDAFISYASEDRHPVVSQIARYLRRRGARIWYDEEELPAGEKLSRMDDGICRARFGLVFISRAYPHKYWTMQELAGLRAREASGHLTILPLLVDVEHEFIVDHFPTLAGVKHIQTNGRSDVEVAFDIIQIIRPELAEYMHAKALLQKPAAPDFNNCISARSARTWTNSTSKPEHSRAQSAETSPSFAGRRLRCGN